MFVDGEIVGGVGVSSGTADQDRICAEAAIAASLCRKREKCLDCRLPRFPSRGMRSETPLAPGLCEVEFASPQTGNEENTMQRMTGGQAVVAALKAEGVEHVFGIGGRHNTPLFDGAYGEPAIHVVTVRHEQGAAMMAAGYARASGKIRGLLRGARARASPTRSPGWAWPTRNRRRC